MSQIRIRVYPAGQDRDSAPELVHTARHRPPRLGDPPPQDATTIEEQHASTEPDGQNQPDGWPPGTP